MPFDSTPILFAHRLGALFAETSAEHDANDTFVDTNYDVMKQEKVFSAMVPTQLGGAGVSYNEMCTFLRTLAGYCPSTALALSMHQHLVGTARKNFEDGKGPAGLLEKVLDDEIVLVSTGAGDWLESNGSAEKVDGGYRVNAFKPFSSGSPRGAIAITSCAFDCPDDGPSVIHFPLPLSAEGVVPLNDWEAMGMRGTGSQTLKFDNVFVPDEAVKLKRPRGPYHGAFSTIVAVAMPLIMSAYVGIAERAVEIAIEKAKPRADDPLVQLLNGELQNKLIEAQIAVESMIAITDDLAFVPSEQLASAILARKTICANAVIATVEKAMELAGGSGFLRKNGLERLLRDAHGGQFHPLPAKRQHLFTGRVAFEKTPV